MEATRAIVQALPAVRVLVFTRHSDPAYLQQLLGVGAAGYVLKQSRAHVVVSAIRAVAAGGKFLDPAVAATVMDTFSRPAMTLESTPPKTEPSEREEEVLRLAAWGHSNKEIAAQLEISVKTVETHKTNAMAKLGLKNRIDVVRLALLRGWLREP
jgi:DNA-binding NarL/FixJ family response regulator